MHLLLQGCKRKDDESQRLMYEHYHSCAFSICFWYYTAAKAKEVVKEGFMNLFGRMDQYNADTPFNRWLGKVMVIPSIDDYRMEHKFQQQHLLSSMDVFIRAKYKIR